jgi:hypothetical protein
MHEHKGFLVRNPRLSDILYLPLEACEENSLWSNLESIELCDTGRISSEMASDTERSDVIQPRAVREQQPLDIRKVKK